MYFPRIAAFSALLLGVVSKELKIPQIDSVVDKTLKLLDNYVHYEGNYSDIATVSKRQAAPYWYEEIAHQGISPYGPSGYAVYRNVKDYGAKGGLLFHSSQQNDRNANVGTGDGVTDDTAAINAAVSDGGRCGRGCPSSTKTPGSIYFPSGTYLISSSIIDQYYTNLIGNPNNPPVLKATRDFSGFGLIDGNTYYGADLNWPSTVIFWRQVRNFVIDMTNVPPESAATGMHWPTAQATSIQNVEFRMSTAPGTQHVGLFVESGSAGIVADLTFNGGKIGAHVGTQQFTMRNMVFNNCATAIVQIWNWGWLYQGISINNCQVGIDISNGGTSSAAVGSVVVLDSSISNTPVGIKTTYDTTTVPVTANSLILENVDLNNVPTAIQFAGGATVLKGSLGTTTIAAWGEGHEYTPTGPKRFQGPITPNNRPASLLKDGKYYARSKPQYGNVPASSFASVRSAGATGNGVTDDTNALQSIINSATSAGRIVYFDAGTYVVTRTIDIPPGAKLVGEGYPIILSSGSFFNDMSNPKPVVRVGAPGATGYVEWSDMIVSTRGTQAGAILIEWNLATTGTPSGMWDVHTRIGGFAGSDLLLGDCPTTPGSTNINTNCIACYMAMHVTPSGSGLYMENVWFWTADHDMEDQGGRQETIFAGRGLFIESTEGNIWLVGTSSEHFTLYQYQFANTKNIFAGFIQTETPYYQPNPPAPAPFAVNPAINDPNYDASCAGQSGVCKDSWALRIVDSHDILIYGAGFYSFFNDNLGTCSVPGNDDCQNNIFSLEGALSNVNVYTLSTIGTTNMITQNGVTQAVRGDNLGNFQDTIALFQLAKDSGPDPPVPTTTRSSTTMVTRTGTQSPTAAPTGWAYKGCYIDNVTGRALRIGAAVPGGSGKMTVEACTTTCRAGDYVLAGLEYAGECSSLRKYAGEWRSPCTRRERSMQHEVQWQPGADLWWSE
ncbi:hypothetical protein V502_11010 [Pseudogymnoascus sp. VKM F-4520 (FW-2644)]|nr:hypothetical protein V502_11010 [Pseudogymnoascus sp. VKM F-4520 (FW-2644)]